MATELLDRQFAALADPSRRAIFETLIREPLPVGRLAERLPISRPAVSQHLKLLEDAGLITHESAGTRNIYRPNPEGMAAFRDYLDILWDKALLNLKLLAESTAPEIQP